jgi:hypothetical protein
MSKRARRIIYVVWPLALALTACKEQPQTIGSNARQDAAAFQGGSAFAAPGWKQGDKVSWESQMKARTQMGQNDYNKVP